MSALVAERAVAERTVAVNLDQVLWQVWKSLDVPEGFRAEIIEGTITLSPTGSSRHFDVNNRVLEDLFVHLRGSDWRPGNDCNVIDGFKVLIPDVFVAQREIEEIDHPEGKGLLASGVLLVVETVSPGAENRRRDHVVKRRAYAAAGIPVYVIIDDHDDGGAVTVLTTPDPKRRDYNSSTRVPYGKEAVIPEGPAKGFVIGPEITGGPRA
ncbi:Uma2 family endonuclease [Kitasatospora sp. SUK 42]|uniref:Uma2 family endonuclease n=1 Tax=Kitasatospora sp. SUK 42 TaxID=1588882 RepID=UPI0018C96DE3|nr:Uma2 family endonuclease [Kitasatospora sp. SUK 42]MBV2152729.1 Uma2 family endonuclease [Kitasatospora sp. SUK 42]